MRAVKFGIQGSWTDVFKEAGAELLEGKCFGWAASLAYYFFLALFPALLFVVSLASVLPVEHLLDRIVTMLSRVAPGDVVRIAQQQFEQIARQPHGGVLTLSLLVALWSTSSGMTAIVDTLNQAYRIAERRSWWRVRLTAVGLTITLTVVTLTAFAMVMAGRPWPQATRPSGWRLDRSSSGRGISCGGRWRSRWSSRRSGTSTPSRRIPGANGSGSRPAP